MGKLRSPSTYPPNVISTLYPSFIISLLILSNPFCHKFLNPNSMQTNMCDTENVGFKWWWWWWRKTGENMYDIRLRIKFF